MRAVSVAVALVIAAVIGVWVSSWVYDPTICTGYPCLDPYTQGYWKGIDQVLFPLLAFVFYVGGSELAITEIERWIRRTKAHTGA